MPVLSNVHSIFIRKEVTNMKIYILIEGPDMPQPDTMDKTILGVFSCQEKATECLEHHAHYISRYEQRDLIFEAGKLKDEYGNIYLELLERDLDACRKETWI